MSALLRSYGYELPETTHDCGRLGGLAQTRKRFLLVARHRQNVPPFLHEPPKRPLRAVGRQTRPDAAARRSRESGTDARLASASVANMGKSRLCRGGIGLALATFHRPAHAQ